MRRFLFPLAALLCLIFVVSQHNPVAAKDTWVSVRTTNFFMLGNAGEKERLFVVQTTAGLLRLRTASFDDIELTTYDPTVKGEITCGERKPENNVIVAYVVNADKKIKGDGILKSIEFVPADFKLKPASKP